MRRNEAHYGQLLHFQQKNQFAVTITIVSGCQYTQDRFFTKILLLQTLQNKYAFNYSIIYTTYQLILTSKYLRLRIHAMITYAPHVTM